MCKVLDNEIAISRTNIPVYESHKSRWKVFSSLTHREHGQFSGSKVYILAQQMSQSKVVKKLFKKLTISNWFARRSSEVSTYDRLDALD